MKKILAVIAVLAITLISSVALAEVTVSGSIDTRGRAFDYNNVVDQDPAATDYNRDTQTRVRLNFDGKAGDAKAKVTVEQDFETWSNVEVSNGTSLRLREAWVDTGLFGPVRLKGGHMLAALGNGWFVRSMKYGSDAWIAYADFGPVHTGLVNVKIADSVEANPDQDGDLYSAVAVYKLSDTISVGANLTRVLFARPDTPGIQPIGSDRLDNVGVHADLGLGPMKLKAEMDIQLGRDNTNCGNFDDGDAGKCSKYKGNQIVVQGGMAAGPANIHFSVGRGTGNEARLNNTASPGGGLPGTPIIGSYQAALDTKQVVVIQDADPHTSFLYEYKFGQPNSPNAGRNFDGSRAHAGYANLTALSAGADVKLGSLTVGGTIWWLAATEDIVVMNNVYSNGNPATGLPMARLESDLGLEVDVRVNWKISDAVSWNTTLGYFIPGSAYDYAVDVDPDPVVVLNTSQSPDEATGIQTMLSMKF